MSNFLGLAARHGRLLLILGLIAGIASPALAHAVKPWVAEMIAGLLFLAALRVGPRQLIGAVHDLRQSVAASLIFQLAMPVLLILIFYFAGWSGPLATALILMAAASPVSGSPHLTIMTGNDPAPALRILVAGTALLPVTIIPVFWLVPALGDVSDTLFAAGRLLSVIAIAVLAAFLFRQFLFKQLSLATTHAIDGISAILMGIVVVGLMSAVGETLMERPWLVALNLGAAFAANFFLQIVVTVITARSNRAPAAAPMGIAGGNRNIGLFLTALPAAVTDPLLLFIGCYQIPMYLTPMLLNRFYQRYAPKPASQSESLFQQVTTKH